MTALERIARAIYEHFPDRYEEWVPTTSSTPPFHERVLRTQPYPGFTEGVNSREPSLLAAARAALTALREPDEAMIQAGVDVALGTSVGGAGSWHAYVAKLLQAAIDAALQEGQ